MRFIVLALAGCGAVASEDAKPDVAIADSAVIDTAPVDTGLAASRERTYAELSREDASSRFLLMIEVTERAYPGCAPAADVSPEEVQLFAIKHWDGTAGVFPLNTETPHGLALASFGLGDRPTGTLTIEPFESKPRFVSYDTSVGKGMLDISRCANFDAL